jgi:hypothetical protein
VRVCGDLNDSLELRWWDIESGESLCMIKGMGLFVKGREMKRVK